MSLNALKDRETSTLYKYIGIIRKNKSHTTTFSRAHMCSFFVDCNEPSGSNRDGTKRRWRRWFVEQKWAWSWGPRPVMGDFLLFFDQKEQEIILDKFHWV